MSDWEADDFDCTAQVTDKIVALGLDTALKTEVNSSQQSKELSEKEKLELQMKSDADIGLDLLGIEINNTESWDNMRRKDDFTDYAEKLSDMIVSKANHNHYLTFVCTLVQNICKPMSKIQLEAINDSIQSLISAENQRIENLKKQELEKKIKKKKKNVKNKTLFEDHVENEFDEFNEIYYS